MRVLLVMLLAGVAGAGCASMISSAASNFADNLSAAVLNQNDPETVRAGAPAYLLLLDSFLQGNPNDPALLAAAANLYASYGAVFAGDPDRAKRLTERARSYGFKSVCQSYRPACRWKGMPFDQYEKTLDGLTARQADAVYAYGVSSLAYIRAHSDDWNALAELPHSEALLNRYLEIGDATLYGSVYTYLGILATLRPPAVGGEPEKGRQYFERAIALTGGTDLSAKVEFARGYARLLYERELHDQLLNEVLAANPNVPGFTLTNVLAQRDAQSLLASADDYF
ncbi:MAG: TRAP transporter TatT component family protein [Gammaproteobacteria bacterium]|nr:TRAP transporter TatT component family protein [Gammaproteobacteria bacterium]MDH5214315.1 TRAP transporter TatT component family protein [Gammaproteobacteria bacterium]